MIRKPHILQTRLIAKSNLFQIEQVDLQFSNGEMRCFERIRGTLAGAVVIAPLLDQETVLLVREYCVGTDRYELGLPKGLMEPNENPLEAANREMMEEIGYGAHDLRLLKIMTTAPGYLMNQFSLVLAQNLYQKKLAGDEPEEIEVVPWKLNQLSSLLHREDFTEARSIAALYQVRDFIQNDFKK